MGLRYTEEHEWLRQEADGSITVGITDYAQDSLGDLVFVQLPELRSYAQGDEVAVLESVKAPATSPCRWTARSWRSTRRSTMRPRPSTAIR